MPRMILTCGRNPTRQVQTLSHIVDLLLLIKADFVDLLLLTKADTSEEKRRRKSAPLVARTLELYKHELHTRLCLAAKAGAGSLGPLLR